LPNNPEVKLIISADGSKAKQEVRITFEDFEKSLKKIEDDFKAGRISSDEYKKAIVSMGKDLEKAFKDGKVSADECTKVLKNMDTSIKQMSTKLLINDMKELGGVILNISKQLNKVGGDFVKGALSLDTYKKQLTAIYKSADEAKEKLDFLSKIKTPFKLDELTEASVTIAKFGFNVEEVLPKIADFAAAYKTDIETASQIFMRAMTGTRGGLMALATQYGITKQKLKEYGAEVTSTGEIVEESSRTQKVLMNILSDTAGASEKAANDLGGLQNQIGNQMQLFKESVGTLMLPTLEAVNKEILELTKTLNKMPDGVKVATAGVLLLGTGLTAAVGIVGTVGGAIKTVIPLFVSLGKVASETGTVLKGVGSAFIEGGGFAGVIESVTAAGQAVGAFALSVGGLAAIVGTAAIALGTLAAATLKVQEANARAEQQKITHDLETRAIAVTNLNALYGNQASLIQNVDNVIKEGVNSLRQQLNGQLKVTEAIKATIIEEQNYYDAAQKNRKKIEELDARIRTMRKSGEYYEPEIKALEEEKAAIQANVDLELDHAQKIRDKRAELTKYNMELKKGIEDAKNAMNAIPEPSDFHPEIAADAFKTLIDGQKTLTDASQQSAAQEIANIQKIMATYALSEAQRLEALTRINVLQQKVSTEQQQAASKEEQAFNNSFNALKLNLEAKRASASETIKALEEFKRQYASTQEQSDRVQVEINRNQDKIAAYQKKTNKEILDDQKKTQKETLKLYEEETKKKTEEHKKQVEEAIKKEEERVKATEEINKQILLSEGKVTEAKQIELNKQIEAYRKQGVDEITLAKYKQARLQEIEKEAAEKRRQLDKEIAEANIQAIQKEYQITLAHIERRKSILINAGADRKTAEEAALREIQSLRQKDLENFTAIEEAKYKQMVLDIQKQKEELKKSGVDRVKIEELIGEKLKNIQKDIYLDFVDKEKQKREEINKTLQEIQEIDNKIAENKKKQKELEKPDPLSGLSLMEGFKPLGIYAEGGETPHLDPYAVYFEEKKKLEDEETKLLEEKAKKQEEYNTLVREERDIKDKILEVQNKFNTALGDTLNQYSSISKSSPWDAEIQKIQKATSEAEKYNATVGSGGGGGGAGGGGGEGSNEGTVNPSDVSGGMKTPASEPGKGYKGMYYSEADTKGSASKVQELNKAYSEAYYATKDEKERGRISAKYASYAKGLGYDPEDAIKIGTGISEVYGFDNPKHDSMAFKAMENLTSEFAIPIITKNMKDMVANMLGGMVSSVQNITGGTTSNQYSTQNSYRTVNYYNTFSVNGMDRPVPGEVRSVMQNLADKYLPQRRSM